MIHVADYDNEELLDLFRGKTLEFFAENPGWFGTIRNELLRRMTAAQESHCRMGVACPLHEGQVHGQEASELRSKLEKYIECIDVIENGSDVVKALQEILDSTDARDALAYEEETSVLLEKEEGARDDAHEKLKRGLFFLDLACHGALGTGHKRVYLAVCGGFDNGTGTQIAVLPDVQEFFDDIAKALGYPNVKALYAKEADEEEAAVEFIAHSKLGEPEAVHVFTWTQEEEPEVIWVNHYFYLQWAINSQGQYVFRVYNPQNDTTSEVCNSRADAEDLAKAMALDIAAEEKRSRE
ncbi:MAG: hypothetical protein ACTS8S_00930 [Giesbergeria sp.]